MTCILKSFGSPIHYLCCIVLLSTITITNSEAAKIEHATSDNCTVRLDGEIEKGDAERLQSVLTADENSNYSKLCLNSPGGSYAEALVIIRFLLGSLTTATVVDQGSSCYSACALIFLSGTKQEGEGLTSPLRFLHVGGKLGFHAPFVRGTSIAPDEKLAQMAYRAGVQAIGELLETSKDREAFFPRSLLAAALKMGPEDYFFIDTVDKLGQWSIHAIGAKPPKRITKQTIEGACVNSEAWDVYFTSAAREAFSYNEPDKDIVLKKKMYRGVLSGYAGEGTYNCVVDVYESDGFYLDIRFEDLEEKFGTVDGFASEIEKAKSEPSYIIENIGKPIYYLYPPDTPIDQLR